MKPWVSEINRIKIRVIPNAKRNEVLEDDERIKVYVKAAPADGKANKAVIEVLADFFEVRKKDVRIVGGGKSREKVVEIDVG